MDSPDGIIALGCYSLLYNDTMSSWQDREANYFASIIMVTDYRLSKYKDMQLADLEDFFAVPKEVI